MGKLRRLIAAGGQEVLLLPPPPPLQPRPDIVVAATSTQLLTAANDADDDADAEDFDDQPVKEEARDSDSNEPLDYTMKRLASSPSPPASLASVGSVASSPSLLTLCGPAAALSGDDVLHRLRNSVLQKRDHQHQVASRQTLPSILRRQQQQQHLSAAGEKPARLMTSSYQIMQPVAQQPIDLETEVKAAYAADCIKSRLDGCGKRVHLFLGILLHFGMPPGPEGEKIFDRVIAFSDENKNLCDRPTPYFMVLDSKLLALIWCKFKGNSSNEYSTLTRAIRSTRQKYKGIFETVENPGKKLYRFGAVALQQFQQLFPGSYMYTAPEASAS